MEDASKTRWRLDGVRVVHADELDINTPQTPGMNRAAAITYARAGAEKLWAGTVVIHPKAKTGAHHHGPVESVIYVVSGRARMRWGDRLEFVAEAGPGDFIYVPPYVPHQEINASDEVAAVLRPGAQRPGARRRQSRLAKRGAEPGAGRVGRRPSSASASVTGASLNSTCDLSKRVRHSGTPCDLLDPSVRASDSFYSGGTSALAKSDNLGQIAHLTLKLDSDC